MPTLIWMLACAPVGSDPVDDPGTSAVAGDDDDLGDTDEPEPLEGAYDGSYVGFRSALSEAGGLAWTCEWDEADCTGACDGNTAPVLSDVTYIVDGVELSTPTFGVGDTVAVRVSFEDAECNLGCGSVGHSFSSPELAQADVGSSCSNMPCDSASSGWYLGVGLGTIEAGDYAWSISITDRCGAEAEPVSGSYSF